MVERREGTSTEGRGLGHSWADDNVARGEEGVDFLKRRPTYPIGDNPRGREIDFLSDDASESYGSRNQVYRAYRGRAPLEGQDFGMPARIGSLQKVKDLRPELPDRSVDTDALNAVKEQQRQILADSDFMALFPRASVYSPAAGATFSPGQLIEIVVLGAALLNLTSATLFIDGVPTERRVLDRRDQESAIVDNHAFLFQYQIPADRPLGPMDITARVFNFATSLQGMVADDALNKPPQADPIKTAVGTINNDRKHQTTSSLKYSQQFVQTGLLRTPEGVSSITVFIV